MCGIDIPSVKWNIYIRIGVSQKNEYLKGYGDTLGTFLGSWLRWRSSLEKSTDEVKAQLRGSHLLTELPGSLN